MGTMANVTFVPGRVSVNAAKPDGGGLRRAAQTVGDTHGSVATATGPPPAAGAAKNPRSYSAPPSTAGSTSNEAATARGNGGSRTAAGRPEGAAPHSGQRSGVARRS